MFETIKDMYAKLFALIADLIALFGYKYNEEEKKFEKIEDAE